MIEELNPRGVCPGPDCPMCSGQHCNACNAGRYGSQGRRSAGCECDVDERHEGMEPGTPEAWKAWP